jgi:hypothetical protein
MDTQPERDLAKAICVAIIKYMQTNRPPNLTTHVTVDLHKLHTWFINSPQILDVDMLEAAMGYNNFCLEVVTTTKFTQ